MQIPRAELPNNGLSTEEAVKVALRLAGERVWRRAKFVEN